MQQDAARIARQPTTEHLRESPGRASWLWLGFRHGIISLRYTHREPLRITGLTASIPKPGGSRHALPA